MVCRSSGCIHNPDTPVWCSVCEGADPESGDFPGGGHHPKCDLFVVALEHPDGSPEHAFATENLKERAAEYREATERSRRVREDLKLGPNPDLDDWTCAVCEGIDPESSDAPNSGHAWQCPLGHKVLMATCPHAKWVKRDGVNQCEACGIVEDTSPPPDVEAGVPLDPAAPDDLRANPDWSPGGNPGASGDMQECDGWHGPETMDGWDNPCTVDHDQSPGGPIFYDSTGPEPNNGWTNTPVDPEDPRLGKHVDDQDLCAELHPKTGVRCEERPGHNFTCGYAGEGENERIWWDTKRPDPTPPVADPAPPVALTPSTVTEEPTAPGELEGDGTGIMPDARCTACGHPGQAHDHRTKRCAHCRDCPGFNATRECQRSWQAHNGACGAPDCVALERCMCGCARVTHSRPNDACARCPCVAFRAGEPEPLVTEEMELRAIRDRKFRFAGDLDMTKVRKQRKTKKGWKCCELCLLAVKEGDEWVSRLGRSVNKRAHLSCADEIALEMADAAKAE